ncbi:MAG: PD40 domain-containing protein, partial [Planctomycetes bacterium]|nr:PD40 domain-containing protein [Planctomycetota bacterium]
MKQAILLLTAICCAITIPITPTKAQAPAREHNIVAEDYFSIGVITSARFAPNSRRIAYTEMRWEPPAAKRNTDLWVVDVSSKEINRLTFDKAGEGSPRWSPDERYIYFTSNYKRPGVDVPPYNGKKQVWRIDPNGGEPIAVTRAEDGVGLYELSADGKTLYYTVTHEETEDEWKKMRDAHKDLKYGHGITKFSQVWKLDLSSWRTEKLVDEKRVISAMSVAPDQSRIAMTTTPDNELIHNEGWSRVDVYDMQSKKVTTLTPDGWREDHESPFGWLAEVVWSDDSKAIAFSVGFDGFPVRIYVAQWSDD